MSSLFHVKPVHVKSSRRLDYVWMFGSPCLINCTWVLTMLAFSGLFTEYMTTTMNPAVSRLLCLHQGGRAIEEYVADFCELSHCVDFNDFALKDIFRVGLNKPIRLRLPGGKINWSLEQYIDHALLLCGSSYTVGFADEEPHNFAVPSTPEHFHVPTFMSGVVHVTPAKPEPAHVTPAKPKPANVTSATPEPANVMSATPGPAHMPVKSKFIPVMSTNSQPDHIMCANPESANVMSATPGPAHAGYSRDSSEHGCHSRAPL